MFSSTSSSASAPVRPQGGNGGWFSSLSTSTSISTDASSITQRKRPLREMTLPVPTNPKELSQNEAPQPVAAVASRLGVLGWFSSSSSINSGAGNIGAVGERPIGDESKTRVEEITVEPECPVPDKGKALLERERQVESRERQVESREDQVESREDQVESREYQVESREKELEERKLAIDQREMELEDRCQGLVDRERVGKEWEEAMQRKVEEVERRERELEERCGEFEKEKEKWVEERNTSNGKLGINMSPAETIMTGPHNTSEWRDAMETLKKEMSLELSVECKKAEERELALEMRVMKRVTEVFALDKDEQNSKVSGWRKRWDVSIKPLTRKATSSTASDFGI